MSDNFELRKFKSCDKCKKGFLIETDDNEDEVAIPCLCLIKYKKKELLRLNLFKSSISYDILEYNIDSYIGELSLDHIKKLKNFVKDFELKFKHINLYLWSKKNSTQKTTVAKWIAKSLIEKNLSVEFILMNNLVKYLQIVSFENKEDKFDKIKEIVNQCYTVDFLIIDDSFDINKVTLYKSKYQLSFLDSFLRERLEQYRKSTCFTSNVPINEIGKNFGKSIEKLVERNIVLPMEFKDYVYGKNKDEVKELW